VFVLVQLVFKVHRGFVAERAVEPHPVIKHFDRNADGDFRLYNRSLAGADYVCKCLGANSYEINKFSVAEETTLSDSVISLIRVLDAKSGRRCCEIERKNRQVAKAAGFNQVVPAGGSIQDRTAPTVRA
jgi:hypothetical protein